MESCFVYVIQEDHNKGRGPCKIGLSDHPGERLIDLQIGNPRRLSLVLTIGPMTRAVAEGMESDLHRYHQSQRIRGEWFKASVFRRLSRMTWMYLPVGTEVTVY